MLSRLFIATFALFASTAFAQEAGDVLNSRCEAARQKRLDPIRREKIIRCERSAHQPAAGCETFYSTYGENSARRNGSVVQGLYYDLPECVEARHPGPQLGDRQAN